MAFSQKKSCCLSTIWTSLSDGYGCELKNLLVRLVLTCQGSEIGLRHVREVLDRSGSETHGTETPSPEVPADAPPTSMKARIEEFERSILVESSRQCRSTYEVAARLGINQSSVVRKMKKYGIPPPASH